MTPTRSILVVFALATAGCSGSDKDSSKAASSKSAAPAPVAAAEPPANKPWTVDRAAFCRDILGADVVGAIFGADVVGGARSRGPDQLVECAYRIPGAPDKDGRAPIYPAMEVTLRVDCRVDTLDVARTRKAVRAAIGADKTRYRDVDYGKGGGRTAGAMKVGQTEILFHQVKFVLDVAPCSASAIQTFWADDKTEELAQLLLDRVTAVNAPK